MNVEGNKKMNVLFIILQVIIIGGIIFYTLDRFNITINVVTYAISKTFIPMLISNFLAVITDFNYMEKVNIWSLVFLLTIHTLIGMVVIKIYCKLKEGFSENKLLYFILIFSTIELIVYFIFSPILSLVTK